MLEADFPPASDFSPSNNLEVDLRMVLREALQLGDEVQQFNAQTPLLGSVPQLDSMGVLAVLTALEQRMGLHIHDDEIDASLFETFGSLTTFVRARLA